MNSLKKRTSTAGETTDIDLRPLPRPLLTPLDGVSALGVVDTSGPACCRLTAAGDTIVPEGTPEKKDFKIKILIWYKIIKPWFVLRKYFKKKKNTNNVPFGEFAKLGVCGVILFPEGFFQVQIL